MLRVTVNNTVIAGMSAGTSAGMTIAASKITTATATITNVAATAKTLV
jgi:hypothetical protein